MRCSWCGGEILVPVKYEAPEIRNLKMEQIRIEMLEKLYCTSNCMYKYLRSFSTGLNEQLK